MAALIALAAGAGLALGGCTAVPPSWMRSYERLQEEINALKIVLTGGSSPIAAKKRAEAERERELGAAAKRSKENSELLQEMYRTVMLVSPSEKKVQFEFAGLVNSLNQGASLEGVYNGMTHSGDFRRLEVESGMASTAALTAFGEIVAGFQGALPAPTLLDSKSTQPLPVINSGEELPSEALAGKPSESVPATDAKAVSKLFVGASLFTLKRVAGDEAMKVLAAKRASREELARWYAKWVVQMAARNVDFGLALRNKPDEQFHHDTALKFGEDRLRWEVLNRVHRVLNQADGR